MFTGIIKRITKIEFVKKRGKNILISAQCPSGLKVAEGQSLSVNGIRSKVCARKGKMIFFEYTPETSRTTTVRFWNQGDVINLETHSKSSDAVGCHIVAGDIKGIGQITAGVNDNGRQLFKIEAERELIARMTKGGFITVDGVSLMLTDVGENWFAVALIPYTVSRTAWKERSAGDRVNIEIAIWKGSRASTIRKNVMKSAKRPKKKAKRI